MAFWRCFKVGQQLDGSRVLQGLSKADPSLTKAGSRWVMMRQSLLIALIATGQLAFIYWQTESSASNMPFLLGHDGPCVIYMLQVAESVLPKTLRDGAYKVIAKAEDLLRKRDGWVD